MTDLHEKIRAAQVSAGELAVVRDLHDRGLCLQPCQFCAAQRAGTCVTMSASLERKLAAMVDYCYELRAKRTNRDNDGFNSYLDDPEVAEWLTRMQKAGRTGLTRFVRN